MHTISLQLPQSTLTDALAVLVVLSVLGAAFGTMFQGPSIGALALVPLAAGTWFLTHPSFSDEDQELLRSAITEQSGITVEVHQQDQLDRLLHGDDTNFIGSGPDGEPLIYTADVTKNGHDYTFEIAPGEQRDVVR